MVPSGYKKGVMLDLILEPAGKYACYLKDVRIYRPAKGAASDHHQVTALVKLPANGGRQKTVQVRTRIQWISGAVAESIRCNPTAYQCEFSTELGVEDEKSFESIVNAIGESAKPIGSAMSKTQMEPWYEESNETLEPLITARKMAWKMYLRNQKEL